jgi:hypothetical protein
MNPIRRRVWLFQFLKRKHQPQESNVTLPILIGLAGYAGSGKDTAADYLVHTHGFIKLAFADPLREEVANAWRINPAGQHIFSERSLKEHSTSLLALAHCADGAFVEAIIAESKQNGELTDDELRDALYCPRSPRWVLQHWGTNYRRWLTAEDYWARQIARRIEQHMADGQSVVISDVRFDDEAELIHKNGGQVWRVWRHQVTPTGYSHSSETPISTRLVNSTLSNDGTIGDMEANIDALLSFIRAKAA